ncbi:tetratricopeptide (TPR) repeat protein [Dysgonomonas sp. PFB1-18]|uniref:tetratricopeptide repeat protein n=1 Tax=unclassified Dysgonomonas TaxID=2630389 RepID=UPI0024743720|nr:MULTISPECIES: tetratricopeptide repeat protein [unclassified Dysgonomonas]MDH6310377.1 tetratricopeptide (TPR) repeat protein [Dysgonomonas sp. PF1-14]MDH6340293.1 tetratricopeptide (TPR) repeat protein [Dysgonomonas sp. PF1-16]MDH6381927.1 tetratricopeptide (TPR) repeat protein [Dysgonomonas sp. PFB1-18]MDH6399264.1 tetratricopeptide (TPR) repeat protein [Dysgonomonas sp. PF1-23]
MKSFLRVITFLLVPLLFACQPVPKIDDKLAESRNLVKENPDSVLHLLQNLEPHYPEMTDKQKAAYGLLLFQVKYALGIDAMPVEKIDHSINYYKKNNDKKSLANSYLYKARMYTTKRKYPEAIQELLETLKYIDPDKDINMFGSVYFNLGLISGYQGELEQAIEYYKQAKQYYEKSGNTENITKIYVAEGWVYQAMEHFEDAILAARKALNSNPAPITQGDLLSNIGNSYIYMQEPDSALYYLHQSLEYPYLSTNLSLRLYNIGNVYTSIGSYDSAKVYIEKALSHPINIYIEEECYQALSKIAIVKNDKENLSVYMAKQQACMDSIRKIEKQPSIKLFDKIYRSEAEASKIKQQQIYFIGGIIGLILASTLILLWMYRGNRKKQIKADTYKSELDKQNVLLEQKHEQLEQKQELLLLEFADELERTRTKYAEMRKNATFEQRMQLEKDVYDNVLHINDEKAFTEKASRLLNDLPKKLKENYPDITDKEIMWCCLFMLQLSTTDISLIMDYKQSSQYKFKQRLCKKLGFTNAKDLEQMLREKVLG